MAAIMTLVFVTLWAGDQNLSMDGCPGFNRVEVPADEVDLIGMEAVAKARHLENVDRVTVEWGGGREVWTRATNGTWLWDSEKR
jgi:hypothetical protein